MAAEPPQKAKVGAALAIAIEGEYVVVGKHPDSDETYQGRVVLKKNGDGFDVTRTIDGVNVTGTASFETAGGTDRIPVLRIRFQDGNKALEATYRWSSDLDNYLRLIGYVYSQNEPTESPGLEALFPAEPLKPRED